MKDLQLQAQAVYFEEYPEGDWRKLSPATKSHYYDLAQKAEWAKHQTPGEGE